MEAPGLSKFFRPDEADGIQSAKDGADEQSRSSGIDLKDRLAVAYDLIQARYGWTDEHVTSIPWCRFKQMLRVLGAAIERDQFEKWHLAGFVGWQTHLMTPLSSHSNFSKWCSAIGLRNTSSAKKVYSKELQDTRKKAEDILQKALKAF